MDHIFLKKCLSYNKETGVFRWKLKNSNRIKVGDIAGNISKTTGYIYIRINKKLYPAHRLAWIYVNKNKPKYFIDHINGDKLDNRFINLREATNSQNKMNAGKHIDNTSGYVGVFFERRIKKWRSQIHVNGKRLQLGCFKNPVSAAMEYDLAAKKHHGKFARLNFPEVQNRKAK